MKNKIIEILKDFRALKPLEQVNQLEIYATVLIALMQPDGEEVDDKILDKMAEEYSKEIIGPTHKSGELRATALEVGFIDGYKRALKSLQPEITEDEIDEITKMIHHHHSESWTEDRKLAKAILEKLTLKTK